MRWLLPHFAEGYFLRIQEHIETTLVKQKINAVLDKIVPITKEQRKVNKEQRRCS